MILQTVGILGTEYTTEICTPEEEPILQSCDGFCDKTTHRIVVATKDPTCNLDDFDAYQRKCLRHETLHAFLFESGLDCNIYRPNGGIGSHDEQMVDWFASQYPKIRRVYEALGVAG